MSSLFGRRTSNIQWCEDVIASHAHHPWIAEYYNTMSNLAFCMMAVIGLYRCYNHSSRSSSSSSHYHTSYSLKSFVAAELVMMIGVGLGSSLFHAHQSRFSQWSDEVPMSLLLVAQIHCLEGLHPWTTTTLDDNNNNNNNNNTPKPIYLFNHTFVFLYWLAYLYWNSHDVFLLGFTGQVIILLCLSYDTARRVHHSHLYWACSIGCLVVAKAIWDVERQRYENGTCDAPWTLVLHPAWHVGASISHYFAMLNLDLLRRKHYEQQQQSSSSSMSATKNIGYTNGHGGKTD